MGFVIYDVETTGLRKRFDQIVQFGAICTDANLEIVERFAIQSRLQPHIIPSPSALTVTAVSIEELLSSARPSHFQMVCEINKRLRAWAPAVLLGYNSISFDEEFLRHALYQCLLDPYLTNSYGNARGDVLRLARAVVHFRPDVLQSPLDEHGVPIMRLQDLAASIGYAAERGHEAMADVEATLWVCKVIATSAPEIWSRFLQFTNKQAAIDFMRDEDAFVLFHPWMAGRGCYVLCCFGRNPANMNVHYCLDLAGDLATLRSMDVDQLAAAISTAPTLLQRVKANASPLLFPTYEGLEKAFYPLSEEDAARNAASLRADSDFVKRLMAAASSTERVYPKSENVEDQLYDQLFDNEHKSLMVAFHASDWPGRPSILNSMKDMRLRRLGQRALYFERPDLLDPATVTAVAAAIRSRWSGPDDAPWLSASRAIAELEELEQGSRSPTLETYRSFLSGLIA